jgi:retinol-binding protein 3
MRSNPAARENRAKPNRTIFAGRGPAFCAMALVSLFFGAVPAESQVILARSGQLPPIDRQIQAAILDSVCTVMDTMYVVHEISDRTVARWRKEFKQGAYRELTDPVEFAERLQADADAVYRNKHFGIAVLPPYDPAVDGAREVDPRESERALRQMQRQNFGFRRVEILPGNIGYIRLDQFAGTDQAAETAIGAMNLMGNADALIFDLRTNPGGDASMIRLLTTYLFKDQQHLIDWYVRDTDETVQSWTLDVVPGRRLPEIPVYVLTSDFTASAAEEFTFDLQHLKRATVVGDTTAGAGHTVNTVFIHFPAFRVGMRVPYGHAVDPKTGKGWEGVGVIPDIVVPVDNALAAAQRDALRRFREQGTSPEDSFFVAWTLAELESQFNPVVLTEAGLREYEGTYGPRRIFMEGACLQYQREGRPKLPIAPMGPDLFRVGDLDYFRMRFDRDASGRIVSLTGIYSDGREESNARNE